MTLRMMVSIYSDDDPVWRYQQELPEFYTRPQLDYFLLNELPHLIPPLFNEKMISSIDSNAEAKARIERELVVP